MHGLGYDQHWFTWTHQVAFTANGFRRCLESSASTRHLLSDIVSGQVLWLPRHLVSDTSMAVYCDIVSIKTWNI